MGVTGNSHSLTGQISNIYHATIMTVPYLVLNGQDIQAKAEVWSANDVDYKNQAIKLATESFGCTSGFLLGWKYKMQTKRSMPAILYSAVRLCVCYQDGKAGTYFRRSLEKYHRADTRPSDPWNRILRYVAMANVTDIAFVVGRERT